MLWETIPLPPVALNIRTMPHNHYNYALAIAAAVLLSFSLQLAQCQVNDDEYNPTLLPLLTQDAYGLLSNLTSTILSAPFTKNASFCIKDP